MFRFPCKTADYLVPPVKNDRQGERCPSTLNSGISIASLLPSNPCIFLSYIAKFTFLILPFPINVLPSSYFENPLQAHCGQSTPFENDLKLHSEIHQQLIEPVVDKSESLRLQRTKPLKTQDFGKTTKDITTRSTQ